MLYDLADGPPRPGSLLESVLMIMAKRRSEVRFLETRVLVEAILAPHAKENTLSEAFKRYMDTLLPYLAKDSESDKEKQRRLLNKWVGGGPLRVKPLWMDKDRPNYRSRMADAAQRMKERSHIRGRKI